MQVPSRHTGVFKPRKPADSELVFPVLASGSESWDASQPVSQ